eukprot:6185301-Pleurochrysis_carterae.AAC.3
MLLAVVLSLIAVLLTAMLMLRRKASAIADNTGSSTASTVAASAASAPKGPLLILWGSQTGTAEGFASVLSREARQRGFAPRSIDLEDYDADDLEKVHWHRCIVRCNCASTWETCACDPRAV